ncbi:unnamed protein product, partial [Urochloa humidicola]
MMKYEYPRLLVLSTPLLLLCLPAVGLVVAAGDVPPAHRPGCQSRCGDVDIPYPFGIGDQCAIHHGFNIVCTTDVNGTQRPLKGPFEVTKISVPEAKAWMKMRISSQCYDHQARQVDMRRPNFTNTPFRFSYVDNKIFVIGCNTLAYLTSESYSIGCLSKCSNQEPRNGSCSVGSGCCQVDVPHDLGYFEAYFNENYTTTTGCGYIVVTEEKAFSYSTTYRDSAKFLDAYKGQVPVVMDWRITPYTCEEAKMNLSSYACVSDKSECVNTTNGAGSRCKCQDGYQGNPYVKDGCTDIDECHQNTTDPCARNGGTCRNTQGNFTCICPRGKQMTNGMCMENQKPSWEIPVVIG